MEISGAQSFKTLSAKPPNGINGMEVAHSVIDPDFTSTSRDPNHDRPVRRDNYITYLADNGTHWKAYINAHQDGSINFKHCPENSNDCHPDVHIRFRTWDGTCRQGTLHNFQVPADGKDPGSTVNITFEVIPCD